MLHVTTVLWDANAKSEPFSRCYDESWVEKLYRGFKRNLTLPFRFVLYTDRLRKFSEPIDQRFLLRLPPDYGNSVEPFRCNQPMIFCGLDTIIIDNVDHLADYCMRAQKIAVPRDPYKPERSINGVVLSPAGQKHVVDRWRGENDMNWMRQQDTVFIDDMWPGHLLSLKFHKVRDLGTQGAKIIYFHGNPKPHEVLHLDWVKQHWQ